ncbi:DUF2970 domain-containing protein [Dasania marina]|uniref:DUF2970 domain-containing protein n=1 Tax=Dasania marina TaxID=471499 RepID=UPI00037FD36F|nr:DUF2970 domain-containing protein [Dasania marina]
MPASPTDKPTPTSNADNHSVDSDSCKATADAPTETADNTSTTAHSKRYFERPDPGEKPIGLLRLMVILFSSHIGVRSRSHREEDFRRANGLHVFIAAIVYFLLVVGALIMLVNVIVS